MSPLLHFSYLLQNSSFFESPDRNKLLIFLLKSVSRFFPPRVSCFLLLRRGVPMRFCTCPTHSFLVTVHLSPYGSLFRMPRNVLVSPKLLQISRWILRTFPTSNQLPFFPPSLRDSKNNFLYGFHTILQTRRRSTYFS